MGRGSVDRALSAVLRLRQQEQRNRTNMDDEVPASSTIMQALQKHGVQVVVCNGEADRPMAEYAREHPEVCGILSNDTDLTMMAGCATLHCKFFDRDDAIKLRSPVMNEKPRDILCEKIEPGRLAMCLEISPQCLPALSILCGNDYSSYYSQQEDLGPLILTCLCTSIGERSSKLMLRPDCRSVTCASQFTSVLEHAYILSSLFNLHDELPLPSELFKVPMYVSFHMVGLGESRYRGPDGQLQEMYRNLIGALPMVPLKDVVTCGGMKGIAPFHDMFASSQTILYELLHPSSTRDAKATHSAVASKPKKKNITSKPKKKSAHAGCQ
eukprot:Em0008g1189a